MLRAFFERLLEFSECTNISSGNTLMETKNTQIDDKNAQCQKPGGPMTRQGFSTEHVWSSAEIEPVHLLGKPACLLGANSEA